MSSATLPTGKSDARYATTAAVAETKASNMRLLSEVQQNADKVYAAATDAAHSAEFQEPKPASALDQLEQGLSQKTNTAALQGAYNVESAKATATGYVAQAKTIAGNVLSTAQSYVSGTGHASTGAEKGAGTSGAGAGGIGATVQAAIETGKEYLASAQATAQPYIESATTTVQVQADKAKSAVSGIQTSSPTPGKPSEVASKTASFESGPHVVGSPYPEPSAEGYLPKKVAEL